MKRKDIYIIKNNINNKVYIGQAKNTVERWLSHIYNAKYETKSNKETSVIHKAMAKYGIQHFHYEILEYQIENYDEREQYWIRQYNSRVPNGYNVAIGGQGTGMGMDSPAAVFKDKSLLDDCICEISSSTKTFTNIAKKYNCSPWVIVSINKGETYRQPNMIYPLRNTNYKYSDELIKQIIYSLKYELDLTMNEIAKKYNIDQSQLSNINQGYIYKIKNQVYPIRKKRIKDLSKEMVEQIIEDIKNSELSMDAIAKKYNITRSKVSSINTGRSYRKNIEYPIRTENDVRNNCLKKFLEINDLKSIIEELKSDLSIKQIANKYKVSTTTICNVNNGQCKKYRLDNVEYPIRKLKNFN